MKIRRHKQDNFTIVDNYILKDKRLTLKAKGLLITVMGLPDTWDFKVNGIATLLKEGNRSLYAATNELIKYGYVTRERIYEGGKVKRWEYVFRERPE